MIDSLEVISVSLHQIDIENNKVELVNIEVDNSDLNDYLNELLDEIDNENRKRSFTFVSDTTEVYTQLAEYSADPDFKNHEDGKVVVERLLRVEIDTDSKYGHLSQNKNGSHVKKGSYLQFLYKENSQIKYLGVKIDHQGFIDEVDLTKHIGLALSDKIYKAVRVIFNRKKPDTIEVYDSYTNISKYWWHDFLELKELRTDSYNTKLACKSVITKIGPLKKISLNDYNGLRNSVIVAFKQKGEMDYDDFIINTFENYTSTNLQINNKLKTILPELKKLPETKEFDTKFNLDTSVIPYKKSTYKLNTDITLTINEGVNNLDQKVWAEKTVDGDELVVIKSPEGFKQFKLKERQNES